MGLLRFDLSSDYGIFFASILVLLVVTIIALERVSPRRKNARRRVRRGHGDQAGELID
ncbi:MULTISPECIES: hypothetical protein [unclassified Sphingomonas]|uniref:hypothetical protein n=1 Tax=unclassified Sphingomonas TaxID=196159 RepID=UPI001D123A41|nr:MULTISPECIES: hypothetical protein [unclassified Sphingomonas]MCC2979596.1 hypothetical protein [Sphingomonas sp. IC4-52]MCD2315174.1 hypothetical protein [Sphingomonas sp. IC-11]